VSAVADVGRFLEVGRAESLAPVEVDVGVYVVEVADAERADDAGVGEFDVFVEQVDGRFGGAEVFDARAALQRDFVWAGGEYAVIAVGEDAGAGVGGTGCEVAARLGLQVVEGARGALCFRDDAVLVVFAAPAQAKRDLRNLTDAGEACADGA